MQIFYHKKRLYVITDKIDDTKKNKVKKIMNIYGIERLVIKENDRISYKLS